MKTFTKTKLTVFTILLTSVGFVFAEEHPPFQDGAGCGHKTESFRKKKGQSDKDRKHKRMDMKHKMGRKPLEQLRKKDPEKFKKLMKLRQEDRPAFFKEMKDVMKDFMKEKHPEMIKFHEKHKGNQQKIMKLSDKYKKAEKPEEKIEIKTKIKSVLGKEFDLKQKMKSKEVKRLENRTNKLKQTLEDRQKNKESIVETKLKTITEGKEVVEW